MGGGGASPAAAVAACAVSPSAVHISARTAIILKEKLSEPGDSSVQVDGACLCGGERRMRDDFFAHTPSVHASSLPFDLYPLSSRRCGGTAVDRVGSPLGWASSIAAPPHPANICLHNRRTVEQHHYRFTALLLFGI